jgi:predicted peroxiredoxin
VIVETKKPDISSKIQEILDQEHAVTKKTKTFMSSDHMSAGITAPTQVGKSEAIGKVVEMCIKKKISCIVSSDNKTNQQELMRDRLEEYLEGNQVQMLTVFDNLRFMRCLKNKTPFVLFCMDNANQIEKLIALFIVANTKCKTQMEEMKKLVLIHDEADIVTKDSNTKEIVKHQPKSHKAWVEFSKLFQKSSVDLKKFFVTATFENCYMLHEIYSKFVISLDIPLGYQGWQEFKYHEIDGMDPKSVLVNVAKKKLKGVHQEAIIYNTDRKIDEQLQTLREFLSSLPDVTIHTYNGEGMYVYTNNEILKKKIRCIKYKTYTRGGKVKEKKAISKRSGELIKLNKFVSIRRFYALCNESGVKVVVTIGKDLINRGISYVSDCKKLPLAATSIIYAPGSTMHNVGIVQVLGRVSGCARPDLERNVYANRNVIDNYLVSNKNREIMLQAIQEHPEELTKTVIKRLALEKPSRSVDRPKLQLDSKFNYRPKEKAHAKGTMERLIDLWWKADTKIGKIFMFVYESESTSETELKEYLQEISGNVESHYQELLKSDRGYNLVFRRNEDKITELTDEAENYIKAKKQ